MATINSVKLVPSQNSVHKTQWAKGETLFYCAFWTANKDALKKQEGKWEGEEGSAAEFDDEGQTFSTSLLGSFDQHRTSVWLFTDGRVGAESSGYNS